MTIQDLKYITPLDIQAAYLNITSSEMYAEAIFPKPDEDEQ